MSKKNNDFQGRFRSKVIAFRVSPEEDEVLNQKVKLSGLTKQDYLIACCTDKEINVNPSPYVFKSIRNQLLQFIKRFQEISNINELSLDEMVILEVLLKTIKGLKENKKAEIKANEEPRQ